MGYKDLPTVARAVELLREGRVKLVSKRNETAFALDTLTPVSDSRFWPVRLFWNILEFFFGLTEQSPRVLRARLKDQDAEIARVDKAIKAVQENEKNGLELLLAAYGKYVTSESLFITPATREIERIKTELTNLWANDETGRSVSTAVIDSHTDPFTHTSEPDDASETPTQPRRLRR